MKEDKLIENIVTGLLRNMLRKNKSYHKEGFKKTEGVFKKYYDDFYFHINLDASGFDHLLVEKSLDELCDNNKSWHKYGEEEIYVGDIVNPEILVENRFISFEMRKEILLKYRNSIFNK